jgi:hypothetical protein
VWHYECNGQPVGPVSEEALKLLIRDGVLARSTLVWKIGMSAWANADATDLMRYFDNPPPLTSSSAFVPKTAEQGTSTSSTTDQRLSRDNVAEAYREADAKGGGTETASSSALESQKRSYETSNGAVRPLTGIANHANAAILTYTLATAVAILSDLATFGFIFQVEIGDFQSDAEMESQAAVVDSFSQVASVAYLLTFAWSAIVVGRWTYRAMNNIREMGYKTSVAPGWAVGWYFVPIASLWMPFSGMAQIWRGSVTGAPLGAARLPSSMRIWWATWLFGNWLSWIAFQSLMTGTETENSELVQAALGFGILGSGLLIAAALLLLNLMKRITRAQSDQTAMQFA